MIKTYVLRDPNPGEYEYLYTFEVNTETNRVRIIQQNMASFTKPPVVMERSLEDARKEWRRRLACGYEQC